ncbi:hypothetical protein BCT30_12625 [Enterovibrio norvegicus]|uniref:DUF2884 family protein n=2 Tax=Enterovibrio norvegicus TaxID=188144 RepID=A0A1I5X8Q0_9GAMM|nr:DUF2884 family protein [Enterovibrio norvegicus]MCC4801088.1 DUF2884 family protein [Enterovibrio norvegicus]OEE56498.1 hypothetical protein A1OS_22170 [Enterovibrio norvegicus]OEF54126.1 hypothetical protein A1OW_22530 [Enterovibrio norvegicus]OEF54435.1 hypothetical protein A1OU_01325 [Enterovibrio norvegicus]PMH72777.1 hypothetical protein BCU62_00115 [Enterovibrio norvegicus]
MVKMNVSNLVKSIAVLLATLPMFVNAETCRPQLHSDIAIDADSLVIERNNNTFRIEPNGSLFFDVHKVALSDEQRASLSAYNKTIRNDLPYISRSLSNELQTSWRALDGVIANELGEKSSLRGELGQFHQHLQNRVVTSFYGSDRSPMLNHEAFTMAVKELEASVPQLIATVSSRGLNDIATLSADKPNKLSYISSKMASLQNKLTDEVKTQRHRTQAARQDVCARLSDWQVQEENIQQLIPALSGWKTVTML